MIFIKIVGKKMKNNKLFYFSLINKTNRAFILIECYDGTFGTNCSGTCGHCHVLFRIYLYEILLARYLNIYVVSSILNFVFDHYKYV